MKHELSGLGAGIRETKARDNIIEPSLKKNEQVFTGDTSLFTSLVEGLVELAFQHAIGIASLLFFTELESAVGEPAASLAGSGLPRRFRSFVN